MQHRIEIESRQGNYPFLVIQGGLDVVSEILAQERLKSPAAMVSNTTVGPLYGPALAGALGLESWCEIPDGEAFKRWPQVETICRQWLAGGIHRGDSVLALGGGVVTDLVGVAAAVYLRGIEWIAIPTTLLAMVDAAIGGKTGFNLDEGKNLVGAFWPPRAVIADIEVLTTLPERELRAGLAEVIKSAWIGDQSLIDCIDQPVSGFADLESTRWTEIVRRAAAVKAQVVADDELERGARQALNFGHTLGHALEAVTGYKRFLHGEAVSWGMRAAVRLSELRDLISQEKASRIRRAISYLEPLPPIDDLDTEQLMDHVARDKKKDDLGVGWVLPNDEGVALGERLEASELARAIDDLKARAAGRA